MFVWVSGCFILSEIAPYLLLTIAFRTIASLIFDIFDRGHRQMIPTRMLLSFFPQVFLDEG
jgi:hypothetical protein